MNPLHAELSIGAAAKPRLFKSTRYPPVTPEEIAMWDWWRAMSKSDPKFEWKMPIEFYGRVVDQDGKAVSDARVDYNWTTVVGLNPSPEAQTTSQRDGTFSISKIKGKRLVVDVSKEGYLRTANSRGSYEYAAFHDELFHVPDKDHPVEFRLQELGATEPMMKFYSNVKITLGNEIHLDVETGQFGATGDLILSIETRQKHNAGDPQHITRVQSVPSGGIALTNAELMFSAPAGDYRTERIYSDSALDPKLSGQPSVMRFFVRTRSGKFAAVELETLVWKREKETSLAALIYFNPSGSRNLQFDQNKWINR